jgi:hypothetical protein
VRSNGGGDSTSGGERQNDGDDGAIAQFAFDHKHAALEFDQRLGPAEARALSPRNVASRLST